MKIGGRREEIKKTTPIEVFNFLYNCISICMCVSICTHIKTKINCFVTFSQSSCKGISFAGLYGLQLSTRISFIQNNTLDVWQARLGHPSSDSLQSLCRSFYLFILVPNQFVMYAWRQNNHVLVDYIINPIVTRKRVRRRVSRTSSYDPEHGSFPTQVAIIRDWFVNSGDPHKFRRPSLLRRKHKTNIQGIKRWLNRAKRREKKRRRAKRREKKRRRAKRREKKEEDEDWWEKRRNKEDDADWSFQFSAQLYLYACVYLYARTSRLKLIVFNLVYFAWEEIKRTAE